MPRHNCSMESLIRGQCKIRKRGCSSSTSSSTKMQKCRFKRALLVRKRGRLNTPVPIWKTNKRTSACSIRNSESLNSSPSQNMDKGMQFPVSGRKLAATLWEMNEIASPRMKRWVENRTNNKHRDRHLFDPSHSLVSESTHRSRTGTKITSHRGTSGTNYNVGSLSSMSSACLMEIADCSSRGLPPKGFIMGDKASLKKLRNVMVTSKELLRLLCQIWGHKDDYASGMFVLSSLRAELDRAHKQVNQLFQEQCSNQNVINHPAKHFTKEKASVKGLEQERIRAAIKSISEDLEMERKLRRRSENFTKTLLKKLVVMKNALSKAKKHVKSEKTAREIMEQVCEELARGIGEDRAEVEELKRKSTKVQEEVEKEREMLQIADRLREERVHMKLLEAKYQFEEKNAVVDRLRNELEAFLKTKQNECGTQNCESRREVIEAHISKMGDWYKYKRKTEHGEERRDEDLEEYSTESDLHSIELNVDNNNRSCTWNYVASASPGDLNRIAVEEGLKGRKSTPEKLPAERILIERRSLDGIKSWDFNTENLPNQVKEYDQKGFSSLDKEALNHDFEVEFQSCEFVNGFRDRVLSTSRMASTKHFACPT